MLRHEQINNKWFVKVEKTFGKVHNNCQTLFSTKCNTLAERHDKYNDRIRFKTWLLLRFLNVIIMIVTMALTICDNYNKFIY